MDLAFQNQYKSGKGTGVGLAFSHRIVDSHAGTLELKSKPNNGSCFLVKLPSIQNQDSAITNEGALSDKVTGKQILVIDDEEDVAQLILDILSDEGFLVTVETTPKQALHTINNNEFDAIICDFKMPGMNGEQFFNSAKIIAPKQMTKIGFVTGDSMSTNVQTFFANSQRPYIEKPIVASELILFVNQLCDGE
jgi:CheY-like chemotaxis protein